MAWFHRQAKFMDDLSKDIQRMVSKRRICCLTRDPTSTLMWSHYAENHHGVCLEFGVDNDPSLRLCKFSMPRNYPLWIPHEFEAQQDRTIEMILTKAEAWGYEREFRLISVPNAPVLSSLRVQDDFFALPSGALKSVIAGYQADYDAINAIVKTHIPDLPVKRAVRVPNHYRLEIERSQA
jgi:hypothetical protein